MKKLKLKALALGAHELLSREQLRNISGGSGSGGSFSCRADAACGSIGTISCVGYGECEGEDSKYVKCKDNYGDWKYQFCKKSEDV